MPSPTGSTISPAEVATLVAVADEVLAEVGARLWAGLHLAAPPAAGAAT